MFGLFKKKKENLDDLSPPSLNISTEIPNPSNNLQEESIKEDVLKEDVTQNPVEIAEKEPELPETDFSKIETEIKDLENLMPKETVPSKNMTLENLCIKIDLEAEDIERRIKEFKTIVSKVSINSSEIFDLLDLYSKAKTKLKEYVQEIDRFDSVGWGVDEETAAFYKFKACKGLARIRKEMLEIEELVKQSGFTPAKIEEILHTPAEKLVDQLAKIKPVTEQKVKKVKKKR
ncbi:MAG: hypothetical protein QW474_02495 [Candidatus Aenigmatarchaeota archaeon]|nr:hypothetical protein [Candidatus Aenigmarchaeota archaeon]